MNLRSFAFAYGAAAVVFLVLDAIWLGLMASRLYRPAIGHLMAERFALGPAALFYLIYLAGLVHFAVGPALPAARPWLAALAGGALFGLVAYATYDLTNQATLKDWPWALTLADLAWGAFVSGVAACAGVLAARAAAPH
jgi:uncharacterized membrane protein